MGDAPPVSADSYDRRYYLESCGGVEFYRAYGPKVLKPNMALALKRGDVRPGMKVLDAGCGRGELLYHLHALGAQAYGLDYSPAAVEIARSHVPQAVFFQTDVTQIPLPDGSLDRIFFIGVFEHLRQDQLERCFAAFDRLLAPGGKVILSTCTNRIYYKNWTYNVRRGLARLLRLKEPAPPRSGEDLELHVNEQSLFSLRAFFRGSTWDASVELLPNFKFILDEIYENGRPADFPVKPVKGFRKWAFLNLIFRPPLRWFLGRQSICVLSKRAAA